MKCSECERDLADDSNRDWVELKIIGIQVEILVVCLCGQEYQHMVSLIDFMEV